MNREKHLLTGLLLWVGLIALVFIVPLIPYSVSKTVSGTFLDKAKDSRATLVFFGFSQCRDLCPVALVTFKQLLNSGDETQQKLRVVYVDIGQKSSQELARKYASSFHKDIVSYHASPSELVTLAGEYGLNIKQYQDNISHQGRTYLVKKKLERWHIVKIFNPVGLSLTSLQAMM